MLDNGYVILLIITNIIEILVIVSIFLYKRNKKNNENNNDLGGVSISNSLKENGNINESKGMFYKKPKGSKSQTISIGSEINDKDFNEDEKYDSRYVPLSKVRYTK